MNKYTLIKQKKDQAIAKRYTKISRRTFPPSIFQFNSIIAPEAAPPDIIPEIVLTEDEPIILLPEKRLDTENPIIESPIEIKPDIVDPIIEIKPDIVDLVLISQSEDIRKLLLLKETIKRFSKKKITV